MRNKLIALLCVASIGAFASQAQAVNPKPDPVNATYLDGKFEVPLHDRSVYLYDPAPNGDAAGNRLLAAKPVCGAAPQPLTATQRESRQCPSGEPMRFADATSRAIVSEGRGLSEFALYEIAGTPLFFVADSGLEYAVSVIANFAGGSGVFFSLGLVPGVGDGLTGSSLLGLGDRVKAVQLSYDDKKALVNVSYLDPFASGTPNFDNPKRVKRYFRVQGRELVEVKAAPAGSRKK